MNGLGVLALFFRLKLAVFLPAQNGPFRPALTEKDMDKAEKFN
jgi:hypothetical protein